MHKARTVVRTGDLMFDWDETFELDLVGNRQLDLLVYSWDPQYRHKLCYKGSVHLASLLKESPEHQLAVKVEPRGTIYLKLRYTDAQQTFRRRGLPVISLATRVAPLFGVDLDTVVSFLFFYKFLCQCFYFNVHSKIYKLLNNVFESLNYLNHKKDITCIFFFNN